MVNTQRLSRNTELRQWSYQYNQEGTIRTALEHVNFGYIDEEADVLIEMCREGRSIYDMADTLRRPTDDIFVIVWDLAHKGKVRLDENWLRGIAG